MDQKEHQLRTLVARRKSFYKRLVTYTFVFLLTIFMWAFTGFGAFWPIWVLFAFLISLAMDAMKIGYISFLTPYLPFLEKDWEEKEVQKLLKAKKT